MNEVWRDISGYEGAYQVSNLGRVRSLDRIVFNSGIGRYCGIKGRILKERFDKDGYVTLNICGTYPKAHRLVLTSFEPIEHSATMEVDHINGNRADNRLENLRWSNISNNRFGLHTEPRSNTGYRGVSFCKFKDAYRAYISKDKRFVALGYFETLDAALFAREQAEIALYGEKVG